MKDALGHGSDAHGGAAHQAGVQAATNVQRPIEQAKLDTFLAGAQKLVQDYYQRNFADAPHMVPPTLEITNANAGRYLRIASVERGKDGAIHNRSAHTFIDKTTGDVLKPSGWKAPAKGVRGNIHDERNGLGRMTHFGPAYNK